MSRHCQFFCASKVLIQHALLARQVFLPFYMFLPSIILNNMLSCLNLSAVLFKFTQLVLWFSIKAGKSLVNCKKSIGLSMGP